MAVQKAPRKPAARRTRRRPEGASAGSETGEILLRRCIVTRQSLPKSELIRFVMAPNGCIVPDIRNKLPGRGVWVTAARPMLQQAIKRNLFARAFDHAVIVPPDLVQGVIAQLQLWIADLLGLAKKAGMAVAGFDKTQVALRQGKVGLLIEARDGAENGKEKLHKLTPPDTAMWDPLNSDALGRALGREQAVHVAIMRGRLAEKLSGACRKLASMEG
ncbi:MAG TPA: RNA-binding protein [Dongiaceae bacterium]|jgi:hypothetical protein|nr:RNA-binding protein [Dongiaceae bacterium]